MTNEEARKLLEQERRERIEKCKQAIENALNEYKCRIDVVVTLRSNQIIPQIEIIPNE